MHTLAIVDLHYSSPIQSLFTCLALDLQTFAKSLDLSVQIFCLKSWLVLGLQR